MVAKTPRLLTAEQREAFVRIPADLSERDLGRFYTLSARDLEIIGRHRRPSNRLGFAVHLGLLRFPGRTLADVPEIPERVIAYIAQQVDVDPAVFEQYGERDNTIFEHLDELRREFGFQNCGWPQLHALGQELVSTVDAVLGLVQNRRRGLFSSPALVNGAFVFDEIHQYDDDLFDALVHFLDIFRGAPVLLMTASLQASRFERLRAALRSVGDHLGVVNGPPDLEGYARYTLSTADAPTPSSKTAPWPRSSHCSRSPSAPATCRSMSLPQSSCSRAKTSSPRVTRQGRAETG